MSDIFFKATSQRAFVSVAEPLGLMVSNDPEPGFRNAPGVSIDTLLPGAVIHKAAVLDRDGNVTTPAVTDANIHYNVRLDGTFDLGTVKRDFERLVNSTQKTVASTRRTGTSHSWFSNTTDGEVWLIDPPPAVPSRIWLGDAAPAVGRGD